MIIEFKRAKDFDSYVPRVGLFKGDTEVGSFSLELLDDLTFRSPDNIFKGPELSKSDLSKELAFLMKNTYPDELSDVSVEEFVASMDVFIADFKIKSWDGEYLPYQ